ncbi:MAG: hypothetical protein ACTMHX_04635 [Bifidobacterium mongoliense]|jgi:hypothetical protein
MDDINHEEETPPDARQTRSVCPVCGREFAVSVHGGQVRRFDRETCRKRYYDRRRADLLRDAQRNETLLVDLYDRLGASEQWARQRGREAETDRRSRAELEAQVRGWATDLNLLLAHRVLVVDHDNPDLGMLDRHDGVLRMSEDWADLRDEDVIEGEHVHQQLWDDYRQRVETARREQRSQAWFDELRADYQAQEQAAAPLIRKYRAWAALNDLRDNHRETYGTELPLGAPDLQPYLRILHGEPLTPDGHPTPPAPRSASTPPVPPPSLPSTGSET